MQKANTQGIPIHQTVCLHIDRGPNISITNNITYLINFRVIKTYYMSSAGGENDMPVQDWDTYLGDLPMAGSFSSSATTAKMHQILSSHHQTVCSANGHNTPIYKQMLVISLS